MDKRFSELTNSATEFASDDVIALDGETNGTRKMSKDDLLSEVKSSSLSTPDGNAYLVTSGDVIRVKDLPSTSTLRSDDTILVDSATDGTKKISKTDLLTETAQSTLAGNLAPEFDPTRTEQTKYLAGELVVVEGNLFEFDYDHYGPWNSTDAHRVVMTTSVSDLDRKSVV